MSLFNKSLMKFAYNQPLANYSNNDLYNINLYDSFIYLRRHYGKFQI